jgi:hypothetical protein
MENNVTDSKSTENNDESDLILMRGARLNTFSKSLSTDENRRKREQHSILIRKDSITHFISKKRLISPEDKVENNKVDNNIANPELNFHVEQSLEQQIKTLLVSLKSNVQSNQLAAATQLRSLYVKSENCNKWK